MEFEQQQRALGEEIETCIQRKDFLKAKTLNEQLEKLHEQLEKLREAAPKGVSARAERLALEEEIKACVSKHDFQAAADLIKKWRRCPMQQMLGWVRRRRRRWNTNSGSGLLRKRLSLAYKVKTS